MIVFVGTISALILNIIVFVSVADSSCLLSNGTDVPIQENEICCGMQIHSKYNDSLEQGCCDGTILYSKRNVICCDSKLIPYEGEDIYDYECCGPTPYKKDERGCCNNEFLTWDQICCNERAHTYVEGGKCCGYEFLSNHDTHYCSDDEKVVPLGTDLCDGEEYNVDTDLCCDDTVLYRNLLNIDQYKCCGSNLTNTYIEQCVWDPVPHNIPLNTSPCGQGYYKSSSQRCCRGTVKDINSSSQHCCGEILYDTKNAEHCCQSVEKLYLPSRHKCCGTSVGNGALASLDQDEDCCGHEKYDKKSYVCCQLDDEKYVIPKNQSHHDRCCPNSIRERSKSYFGEMYTCTNIPGEEPQIVTNTPKCGTKTVNDSTDLCCNTVLYKWKKSEGFQCCDQGYRIFHPSSQICCNSVVFNKTEKPSCFYHSSTDPDGTVPGERQTPDTLCNLCNIGINTAIQLIKERKITICKQRAIKLKQLLWSPRDRETVLEGKIDKDIYDVGFTRKRKQVLVIPCTCRFKTRNVLVITNKYLRGGVKHLDDQDLVLPFSGRIKRLLTQFCPLDVINNMRENIGYLLHKIDRVKNRLLGYKS